MIGTLDPTRANAPPLEEIVRDYGHVARIGILPLEALVVHAKLAQVEQYGVFASRTTHQPAMPQGQPQQGGHSKPHSVGGKPMVQQQRSAPSKPGAG
jgi:hypothetical protein